MALTSASVWAWAPADQAPPAASPIAIAQAPSPGARTAAGTSLADLVGLGTGAEFSAGTTVVMEGRLGHPVVAAGRDTESFLFLDLQAAAEDLATTSVPVSVSIVVDRSGSMQGTRLENAMAAARGMVMRLRDGDTVSVVAYNTATTVLVSPTVIDERSRQDVMLGLRGVEAQGNTCISCGIEASMDLIARRPGTVHRMLLLSDGEANIGVRDIEGFRRLAERARGMEASISSIGVDVDYNERIMFALAQASNGRHYFVEDPSGLPRIFDDELQSLVRTVASDAEVEIDLAPGIELAEVYDRVFRRDGNRLFIPFGTFTAGDQKTLLVRLRLGRGEPGRRAVGEVRLRYNDLVTGAGAHCEGTLAVRMSDDASELAPLDPFVETRLARAETTQALTRANALFSEGNVDRARETLAESRGRIVSRRKAASSRAPRQDAARVEAGFDEPFDALDKAEVQFEDATLAVPNAPASSREGRASVRANQQAIDPLSR
jgi:Ca-activated chloride channel family protein